jgi:hypothetical protein
MLSAARPTPAHAPAVNQDFSMVLARGTMTNERHDGHLSNRPAMDFADSTFSLHFGHLNRIMAHPPL